MWNPRTYRDTDYGLPEEESFEPASDTKDVYEPAPGEPFIQTVLGPIPPEDAGVTLVHEYLQWSSAGIGNPQAALQDLEAFFTASGRTLVASTPADAGRDAAVLRMLAQHAPVHLVAATGWSSESAIAHDQSAVEALIRREIDEALDDTPVRPGMLVGRVGAGTVSGAIEVLAAAQARSGLPVTVMATDAEAVVRMAAGRFEAGPLIVGGPGARGADVARSIIAAGGYVLVAPLEGRNGEADREAATLVVKLVDEGHEDRVLVSHGFTSPGRLNGYGGQPGLAYIVEQFAVMLLESGLQAPSVRTMLVDNAAAALTIQRASTTA